MVPEEKGFLFWLLIALATAATLVEVVKLRAVVPETWRAGALNAGVAVTVTVGRVAAVLEAAAAVKKALAVLTVVADVARVTVVTVAGFMAALMGVGLLPRTLA